MGGGLCIWFGVSGNTGYGLDWAVLGLGIINNLVIVQQVVGDAKNQDTSFSCLSFLLTYSSMLALPLDLLHTLHTPSIQ